jgi:hypothetical protein
VPCRSIVRIRRVYVCKMFSIISDTEAVLINSSYYKYSIFISS